MKHSRINKVLLIAALVLSLSAVSCQTGDTGKDTDTEYTPFGTETPTENPTEEESDDMTEKLTEITTDAPRHDAIYASEVKVDTSSAQTEFAYNEKITSEGIRLIALMSDGEEKELSLDMCDFYFPTVTEAGEYTVEVDYFGGEVLDFDGNGLEILLTYTVTVKERVMPDDLGDPLAKINGAGSYRVEAEAIDFSLTNTFTQNSQSLIISDNLASGKSYVANYSVIGNVFGFSFSSDREYADAKITLRMANPNLTMIYPHNDLAIYLNFENDEKNTPLYIDPSLWLFTRAPAVGGTEEGDFTLVWSDIVIEGVTIREGVNTLTFDIIGESAPYFDYVEITIDQ